MRRQGLGQLGEIVDRQRQRTRERAVRDLLAIARVEQHDALAGIVVALFDPARQVRRRNRRRASAQRRGVVAAEADDLRLDLHLEPRERLRGAAAVLHLQAGEARIGAQLLQEVLDGVVRTGQEQVDPLARHQHGSQQRAGFGALAQAPGQGVRVVDGSEVVGGDIGDHGRILRNAPRGSGKPHGRSPATRGGARTAPPKAGAYTMRRHTLPRAAWQPHPPSTSPTSSYATRTTTAPPKAGAYTMRRQTLPRVAWQPNPPSTRPSCSSATWTGTTTPPTR